MESSSDELHEEGKDKLSSLNIAEKNCLGNGKIPVILSTSVDSSLENIPNSEMSLCDETEQNSINNDRDAIVHERNGNSNSPILSSPYTVHTCPKGYGNVPPNGQATEFGDNRESQSTVTGELECNSLHSCPKNNDQYPTENYDTKLEVEGNPQAFESEDQSVNDNMSLSINEPKSDFDNFYNSTPMGMEFALDSSVKPNQPNVNLFSDSDSSSKGSNKIPSLILKRWEDSPSESSVWYNLKPCLVVLQRCDINENNLKSLSCNSETEQLNTISVISDMDDESDNISVPRSKLGKLRGRKPHSESLQKNKKERSIINKNVKATIKGTSKMRKNNSKVLGKRSNSSIDSDLDYDEPNSNNIKTIEVSAQVHKPPESNEDSDAVAFNTTIQTSSKNCRANMDITIGMELNTSADPEKIGKRKRNSSSISSMSFSEFLSDDENVGSKRRIIKPSANQLPSLPIHKKVNPETVESTSDLDAGENLQACFQSSENRSVEIHPDNDLCVWPNQPDSRISKLIIKQCQVVLSRCDDQINVDSSNVTDVNSRNQIISRMSSDSNLGLCPSQNPNTLNTRGYSDSFLSELSDTDEVTSPIKKNSPKWKKKRGFTKKKRLDSYRSAKLPTIQKSMKKSGFMKEILELKNSIGRVEQKVDKLIKLHLQLLDSD